MKLAKIETMNVIQAILLGLVQGVTEMLPISSSAHLVLVPWFLNFEDPGLAYDVALHLGTLFALIAYFWRDWLNIVKDFFVLLKTRKIETFEHKLTFYLIIATIPGILAGVFLESQAETIFRSPYVIVATLVIMGALLLIAENKGKKDTTIETVNAKSAFSIGVAQALAIIPGVSRSGATMTAGLFFGLKREDAAKFSFLMSAPIIAGAGLYQMKDILNTKIEITLLLVGFFAAFVSSFLAIKFLLRFLKNHKFNIFAYYRFVLAGIILLLILLRG